MGISGITEELGYALELGLAHSGWKEEALRVGPMGKTRWVAAAAGQDP